MSIFDLLFLLAILATLAALAGIVIAAVRSRRPQIFRILRIYFLCACAYLVAGVAVSFLRPQRVLRVGEAWCFDDWCLTVERVDRTVGETGTVYKTDLRIFSRAGRITQRANGAWIYLIDDQSRRYPPDSDPAAVPMDVLLRPNEAVDTSRHFHVPGNVRAVGLITGHGGGYCGPMVFLIIGEGGCLFGKPTMVRIP